MNEHGPPCAESMTGDREGLASWDTAIGLLSLPTSMWTRTVRPDGRPHVMPVLPVWLDGAVWFSTSHASQQSSNLASNPQTIVSVRDDRVELVVEGTAVQVADDSTLRRVAACFVEQQGWEVEVRDGAFHTDDAAPSAGEPPFNVYAIRPERACGLPVTSDFTPTRWRF